MLDDMPRPSFWVSISVSGDGYFVHVRDEGSRRVLGPFASNIQAARRAKDEIAARGTMAEAA